MAKKSKPLTSSETTYTLLPDTPLTIDKKEEIKFGHNLIAEVLTELIQKVEPPFTFGLFGKWGSGKSTILNLIESNLKTLDIATVTFDVWKYDEDSLRRQFLIKIDEDLKLDLKYKEKLNQSLSIPYEIGILEDIKLNLNKLVTRTNLVLFGSIVLFSGFAYAKIIPDTWIFETLRDSTFVVFILSFILGSVNVIHGTRQEVRTDSAEGFEDRFYNEVLPKIKGNKILIVIDNLDRTSHDKAVSLLSDIKTFLGKDKDQNKAIFLIACDEEAIKKHLEKSKFDNPTEFLRKFFNTSIKIPKFLGEELDDYTRALLKATKLKQFTKSTDLEWLITYSYRDNPREIKQFINTLLSQYLLAKKAEDTNQIVTKGIITNNVDALAKILIIRQKFPVAFHGIEQLVLERALTWEEVNNRISDIYKQTFSDNDSLDKRIVDEREHFKTFLNQTRHIDISPLSIFIRLRQSDQEQILPGVESYFIAAEEGKFNELQEIYNKFDKDKLDKFDDLLKTYIAKVSHIYGDIKVINLFVGTKDVVMNDLIKLPRFINEFILNFPESIMLIRHIQLLPPLNTVNTLFPLTTYKNRLKIAKSYLDIISRDEKESQFTEEHVLQLFDVYISFRDELKIYEHIIVSSIEKQYYLFNYLKFLNEKDSKYLIHFNSKLNYLNSFEETKYDEDEKYLSEHLDLAIQLNDSLFIYQLFMKIKNIIDIENQKGTRHLQRRLIIDKLLTMLERAEDQMYIDSLNNYHAELNLMSSDLIQWFDAEVDDKSKMQIVLILDKLSNYKQDQNIINVINTFLTINLNFELLNTIQVHKRKDFYDKYYIQINSCMTKNADVLDFFSEYISEVDLVSVLSSLIHTNPNVAIDKLNTYDSQILNISHICNVILSEIPNMEFPEKEKYINYLIAKKCGKDLNIIQGLFNYLMDIKTRNFDFVSKYAKNKIFNKDQKQILSMPLEVV